MGAWSYCRCGRGLSMPSFVEAIVGIQLCDHCGNERTVDNLERQYAAEAVIERLGELEAEVKALKQKEDEL